MKDLVLAVTLLAAPAAAQTLPAVPECSERELDAGTVLGDGTVAGEKQALEYFKAKEPELYRAASALPPKELRARFAEPLMWFQRVGNCRKRQKAESIRRIKSELAADGFARVGNADKARAELETSFDAEMAVLEQDASNMENAVREMAAEARDIRKRVDERRRARKAIIDKRLKELLGR